MIMEKRVIITCKDGTINIERENLNDNGHEVLGMLNMAVLVIETQLKMQVIEATKAPQTKT